MLVDKKVLFLSNHLYFSKRKAGFHNLANYLLSCKNHVVFCTVPNSLVTILRERGNLKQRLLSILFSLYPYKSNYLIVSSYISLFHNETILKGFHFIKKMLFVNGYSRVFSYDYDVIVFESNVSLFLADKLKKKYPNAKFIYRVSDDLSVLGHNKILTEEERRVLPKFEFVSTASSYITRRLVNYNSNVKIVTHHNAINKDIFNHESINPYQNNQKNFIFVGSENIDYNFLELVKNINKEWLFHIIGNIPCKVKSKKIIYYGEMEFKDTVKYIKYSDVGLNILSYKEGIEAFERTLKYIQYSYCNLPVICPEFMKVQGRNVFEYGNSLKSVYQALENSLLFNSKTYDNSWVLSWKSLGERVFE